MDKACYQSLWGQPDVAWEWQPAMNAAEGLLCAWNNNTFQVDFRFSDKDFIMLGGVWPPNQLIKRRKMAPYQLPIPSNLTRHPTYPLPHY